MNLYDLAVADRDLYDMLADDADIDQDVLYDMLQSSEDALNIKGARVAAVYKALTDDAEKLKERAKKYTERARNMEKQAERMRAWAIMAMKAGNVKQCGDTFNSLKLLAPSSRVVISDSDAVPLEYVRVTEKVDYDKLAIKAQFKIGKPVPGCELEYNDSLKII